MIESMHELGHQCISHRWKFVVITLCPTGEVLVSIAQPSHDENDSRFFSYNPIPFTLQIERIRRNSAAAS
jgi:hypothetical protein